MKAQCVADFMSHHMYTISCNFFIVSKIVQDNPCPRKCWCPPLYLGLLLFMCRIKALNKEEQNTQIITTRQRGQWNVACDFKNLGSFSDLNIIAQDLKTFVGIEIVSYWNGALSGGAKTPN